MSRTVKVNPLLVLVSVFVAADLGAWVGGIFGGFVAALLAIPTAGVIQVIVREVWQLSGEDPSVDPVEVSAGAVGDVPVTSA